MEVADWQHARYWVRLDLRNATKVLVQHGIEPYTEGVPAATGHPFLTRSHGKDAIMAYGNVQKTCLHCDAHFVVPSNKRQLQFCSFECRFWSKIDRRGPSDCWLWIGPVQKNGYGKFSEGKTTLLAHRVVYEREVGHIHRDLVVDHVCNERLCVNPAHLQIIPQRANVMRGAGVAAQNARKTHCKNGHPLSGANLVLIRQKNGRNERRCRTCEQEKSRQWDAAHREQRAAAARARYWAKKNT